MHVPSVWNVHFIAMKYPYFFFSIFTSSTVKMSVE